MIINAWIKISWINTDNFWHRFPSITFEKLYPCMYMCIYVYMWIYISPSILHSLGYSFCQVMSVMWCLNSDWKLLHRITILDFCLKLNFCQLSHCHVTKYINNDHYILNDHKYIKNDCYWNQMIFIYFVTANLCQCEYHFKKLFMAKDMIWIFIFTCINKVHKIKHFLGVIAWCTFT